MWISKDQSKIVLKDSLKISEYRIKKNDEILVFYNNIFFDYY